MGRVIPSPGWVTDKHCVYTSDPTQRETLEPTMVGWGRRVRREAFLRSERGGDLMATSAAPSPPARATPPAGTGSADTNADTLDASRVFSLSLLVSGVRCTLTYVVFPWVLPLLGIAGGVGPAIGIVVGMIAIAANLVSIRRFRRSTHPWRRQLMALNSAVIAFLVVLVVIDVAELAA